ncbi:MAG TPA: hypothetical protein VG253_26780 [Streptosporangiaceae bacterium]|jgi:hypothetical protein|nr:hypothetical protein [Streptosporangiaceae bacterium]
MTEENWSPDEDPEAPTDDALEQHQTLPGEDGEDDEDEDFEVPIEADEADAAEQHMEVHDVDDDDYR